MMGRFSRWLRRLLLLPTRDGSGACRVEDVICAQVGALASHRGWTDAERESAAKEVVGWWRNGLMTPGSKAGEYVLWVEGIAERHVQRMRWDASEAVNAGPSAETVRLALDTSIAMGEAIRKEAAK